MQESKHRLPMPGLRNLKTGLGIFICLVLYAWWGRSGVILAAIAVLVSMQDSVGKTIEASVSRVVGTVLGGIFGAAYLLLVIPLHHAIISSFVISLGVVILIYIMNLFKLNSSIVIACFVYLVIILDSSVQHPLVYAANRTLDTTIGLVVALVINRFFFQPPAERTHNQDGKGAYPMIPYQVTSPPEQKTSVWSGGTTTELLIYPEGSTYANRDFSWRISTATVDVAESDFTKLPGYTRHLMVLEGKTKLIHEGHHTIVLNPFEEDTFEGDWVTKSVGTCTDFNLMLAGTVQGELLAVTGETTYDLHQGKSAPGATSLMRTFYILQDQAHLEIRRDDEILMEKTFQKGDFVVFDHLEMIEDGVRFVFASKQGVVAVSALVQELK